jgi:hypothetical protein
VTKSLFDHLSGAFNRFALVQLVPSVSKPYFDMLGFVQEALEEVIRFLQVALIYFEVDVAFPEVFRLV